MVGGLGMIGEGDVRWMEKGTCDGNMVAIKNVVQYRRIHGWLGPKQALDGKLLQIASEGCYEKLVKQLQSGIRLAEKRGLVAPVVREVPWVC